MPRGYPGTRIITNKTPTPQPPDRWCINCNQQFTPRTKGKIQVYCTHGYNDKCKQDLYALLRASVVAFASVLMKQEGRCWGCGALDPRVEVLDGEKHKRGTLTRALFQATPTAEPTVLWASFSSAPTTPTRPVVILVPIKILPWIPDTVGNLAAVCTDCKITWYQMLSSISPDKRALLYLGPIVRETDAYA